MDKKEKQAKKSVISKAIDLANGRYKDEEIDTLYDLVKNSSEYNGKSKTHKNSFKGFSSEGRYTGTEETTYTIRADDNKVKIEERYQYNDSDGDSRSYDKEHTKGRDILSLLHKIKK